MPAIMPARKRLCSSPKSTVEMRKDGHVKRPMGTFAKSLFITYLIKKDLQKSSSMIGTTIAAPASLAMTIPVLKLSSWKTFGLKPFGAPSVPKDQSIFTQRRKTSRPVKTEATAWEGLVRSLTLNSEYFALKIRSVKKTDSAFTG